MSSLGAWLTASALRVIYAKLGERIRVWYRHRALRKRRRRDW